MVVAVLKTHYSETAVMHEERKLQLRKEKKKKKYQSEDQEEETEETKVKQVYLIAVLK